MSRGVIVGYDGSDCAKTALHAAIEVGRAYGEPVTIVFGYALSPVGGELHDYHAALKELATARLDEARALASAQDGAVELEAVIVEQAPADALIELADAREARVIVVGTGGESPLRGALLGSTPHKLLQMSRRPVLVVPIDYE
jgi:nucleotide-binding universal stress UspA family protein